MGMLNSSNKNTSNILLGLGLISIIAFILTTDVFTDNSVISNSNYLVWGLVVSLLPAVMFVLFDLKYSLLVTLISIVLLITVSILLIIYRNTVGFFIVSDQLANEFINNAGVKEYKDIVSFSGEWIKNQSVTVLIYGKNKFEYENSEKSSLEVKKLKEIQEKFIERVKNEASKRNKSDKCLIISEDWKSLKIKNKADEKLFANFLNQIMYSKLSKNTVLVFKVNNYDNLIKNGFNRYITNKSDEGSKLSQNKTNKSESEMEDSDELETMSNIHEEETKSNDENSSSTDEDDLEENDQPHHVNIEEVSTEENNERINDNGIVEEPSSEITEKDSNIGDYILEDDGSNQSPNVSDSIILFGNSTNLQDKEPGEEQLAIEKEIEVENEKEKNEEQIPIEKEIEVENEKEKLNGEKLTSEEKNEEPGEEELPSEKEVEEGGEVKEKDPDKINNAIESRINGSQVELSNDEETRNSQTNKDISKSVSSNKNQNKTSPNKKSKKGDTTVLNTYGNLSPYSNHLNNNKPKNHQDLNHNSKRESKNNNNANLNKNNNKITKNKDN